MRYGWYEKRIKQIDFNAYDKALESMRDKAKNNRRPETEGSPTPLVGINLIYGLIGALWVICFIFGN